MAISFIGSPVTRQERGEVRRGHSPVLHVSRDTRCNENTRIEVAKRHVARQDVHRPSLPHCAEQIMIMAGIAHGRGFTSQKPRARTSLLLQPYGLISYALSLCCGRTALRRLFPRAGLLAALFS